MTTEELSKLIKEGFEQTQRQFEDVNRRLGSLETDVAWIKGKLEGTQEGQSKCLANYHDCHACRSRYHRPDCAVEIT